MQERGSKHLEALTWFLFLEQSTLLLSEREECALFLDRRELRCQRLKCEMENKIQA